MLENIVFQSNFAERSGGAIQWDIIEPLGDISQIAFINNSALVYGNDISSYPLKIIMIDYGSFIGNSVTGKRVLRLLDE